jgi:hypothetical protein
MSSSALIAQNFAVLPVAARMSTKLQAKFAARQLAMQRLQQMPARSWKATAAQLAAELAPRHGRGFSAKNLLTLFREYRDRGPSVLVFDYAKTTEVSADFKAHLARRVENNQRSSEVELDAVRGEWFAGQSVPGLGSWPELWTQRFPDEPLPPVCPVWFVPCAFSIRTLRRLLPSKAELMIARRGYFAAHGLLPQKNNDYSQLRALECVVFDDVKTDWLVSVSGVGSPCELWLLVAMDAATGRVLDWVALAAVPGDDGKRNELLAEHMRCLVGQVILKHGISEAYPLILKVENAKATLSETDRAALAALAGEGRIQVSYTRMRNNALPGGYTERTGTPWDPMKARLESFFRTFHDHGATLPGQTGSLQVLNKPAELEARKKEHEALMREAEELPAEVREQLKSCFLKYSEAIAALERLFAHLNARTEHKLQGYERVQLWRFPEDHSWRPLDELRRYGHDSVARALFTERMESPDERFARLSREQPARTAVPEEALLPFLSRTIKRVRHPAPYTIAWTEKGVEWMYRGELPELADGRGGPFSVKILPGNVSVAYLYAESGARLGALRHVAKAGVLDTEAQGRSMGELNHVRSLVTAPVLERHAADRTAQDTRRAGNAAIIAAAKEGRAMVEAGEVVEQVRVADTAAQRAKNLNLQRALAAAAKATLSTS